MDKPMDANSPGYDLKQRLEMGKEIIALTFDGKRSAMIKILSIDDDGNKKLEILGRASRFPGLN